MMTTQKATEEIKGVVSVRNSVKAAISILFILIFILIVTYPSSLDITSNRENAEQTSGIWREQPENDVFIPKTYGYDDKIIFTFVLHDPEYAANYYATYEIKEDGNTIESADSKLYENVTTENPILIEIPRKYSPVYELKIMITDEEGNKVHQSGITIGKK